MFYSYLEKQFRSNMAESTFEIVQKNRHLLINYAGEYVLIDTGSPTTFHRNRHIEVCGQTFDVGTSFMGMDLDYISDKVGLEMVGLIGMDVIGKFNVCINTEKFGNFIGFDTDNHYMTWQVEAFSMMGCPGIVMNVNGRRARMLFDTGAPVSYIDPAFTYGIPICGHTKDFTPLTKKEFEVDLHSVSSSFMGKDFIVNYGDMPESISVLLKTFRVDGIIGYDLMENFRILLQKGVFVLPPQGI